MSCTKMNIRAAGGPFALWDKKSLTWSRPNAGEVWRIAPLPFLLKSQLIDVVVDRCRNVPDCQDWDDMLDERPSIPREQGADVSKLFVWALVVAAVVLFYLLFVRK